MIDITAVIQAVIALFVAVITYMVIPYIKGRVSEQKFSELCEWVGIAVDAAEQLYKSGNGDEKKQYVMDFLAKKGFTLDTDSIDTLIEAHVLQLKQN